MNKLILTAVVGITERKKYTRTLTYNTGFTNKTGVDINFDTEQSELFKDFFNKVKELEIKPEFYICFTPNYSLLLRQFCVVESLTTNDFRVNYCGSDDFCVILGKSIEI